MNELIPFDGSSEPEDFTQGRFLTSYTGADAKDGIARYRAAQGSDFTLDDCEGKEITVEHVYAHWAPWVDPQTGEAGESVRTVLIAPDGTRYSTRSNTVAGDIRRAAESLGRRIPFKPALRFIVRRVPNRAKTRKYLQLELIGEVSP